MNFTKMILIPYNDATIKKSLIKKTPPPGSYNKKSRKIIWSKLR